MGTLERARDVHVWDIACDALSVSKPYSEPVDVHSGQL